MRVRAPDTLAARCREILEWKQTSLLVDGELRKLARSMHDIPESYRLILAEDSTKHEAMEFVVASSKS